MYVKGIGSLLIVIALIIGVVGCGPTPIEYTLSISSTEGGEVTSPGEETFTYDEGEVVNLVATPDEYYRFVNWTGDVGTVANVNSASTAIIMNDDYSITAQFAPNQCDLTISSTEGGSVTTPSEGTFTYDEGTVVDLLAEAEEGYEFAGWTGDISTVTDVNAASTTITMGGPYSITANFAGKIWDWHDLHAIRDNLRGNYLLMNDLDSTTAGYAQLASPTANQGKGWQPIGSLFVDPFFVEIVDPVDPFTGILRGQGYEIRDLFINRPDEDGVGLLGHVGMGGVIEDVGVVNATVTGDQYVGGLVGESSGTVSNSYSTGSVSGGSSVGGSSVGGSSVGGLVGAIHMGIVSNSYFDGSVTGGRDVGGLVGQHWDGMLGNSYCTGSVSGDWNVGGLVGTIHGSTVSNSYFAGGVTGHSSIGGLVGWNHAGIVSNSYYDYDEVLINGQNIIAIGALGGEDFEQWLANDKSLDVNERLSQEHGYYVIDDVSDFKQLLAFGQDDSLKFRLENDLDLGNEPNFYIPYLAGEFDGNDHKISNLTLNLDSLSHVGLFGFLYYGGKVSQVSLENVSISSGQGVGGLVGSNRGTVSNSYSSGSVTGESSVGGLVGDCRGTVSNSYSRGSVTGHDAIGGLMGWNCGSIVSNSYYNYDKVLINGQNIITIGALFNGDFEQWLANDKFLDVNERLSKESGYYLINNVGDFKQLLAFGQDGSLKFRLKNDLDLGTEANFYIPYLAGEFDGNGHKITNLSLNLDFVYYGGLFGLLDPGGKVSQVSLENVSISGLWQVGGLVGTNAGTVSNSYSSGSVTGGSVVGGLVGGNHDGTVSDSYSTASVTAFHGVGGLVGVSSGTVSNSYSTGSVTGDEHVGGLVGLNHAIVSNSYSTGSVTSGSSVGGLVGWNRGTVSRAFWDTQTSGRVASAGGTGKTTAEMQDIATFSGATWDITAVAASETNLAYTWNIVDDVTYPFLSWQSVS